MSYKINNLKIINDLVDAFSKLSLLCDYLNLVSDDPEFIISGSEFDSAADVIANLREDGLPDDVRADAIALLKRGLAITGDQATSFLRRAIKRLIATLETNESAASV